MPCNLAEAVASSVSVSGALRGPEHAAHSDSRTSSKRVTPRIGGSAPHGALAVEHGFQSRARFFGKMIGLIVGRIMARLHIFAEFFCRLGDQRGGIAVATHEFCRRTEGKVKQIVEDQNLAVA